MKLLKAIIATIGIFIFCVIAIVFTGVCIIMSGAILVDAINQSHAWEEWGVSDWP